MTRIITNTTSGKTSTQDTDFAKVTEAGATNVKELGFADLHALYELEYKKYITDTSVEIEQRVQKLLESKTFRKFSSDRKDKQKWQR